MNRDFYDALADQSIAKSELSKETAKTILTSPDIELMPLLNAAYTVRKHCTGKEVLIHIINNAQNGFCPEDCHYCAQAKTSDADIEEYPLKSDEEILSEAESAYKRGAHRYCMVFAGRGPSQRRVERLSRLIQTIKERYPLEICVSAGLLDEQKAGVLKEAGLDRLNHNLNTSSKHYAKICTTHTYEDRLHTLESARKAGISLCSGVIIGMKETADDIIDVAYTLRSMKVESIPVNLFIPIKGNQLNDDAYLTPDFCLRVLCLYRFLNPTAEVRIAAGRELHLRSMEVLALYPANSLFLDGYLNTLGNKAVKTLQMIKDAGFTIKSEYPLEDLIQEGKKDSPAVIDEVSKAWMKGLDELRPQGQKS